MSRENIKFKLWHDKIWKSVSCFFIFIPLMWKCHGIGNNLMFHTNYCGLALYKEEHHNLLKHLIHILCSLSFVLGNSVRRWGWGWLDFCDTFVSYSICTTSSWSISDRKVHVWADILNAVYFRRGLTCTFGITNNLIHVDGGPPRAKNHFVFALHRWGLALWSWPLSIKLLVNPRLHIRPCLKLTAFNKSALYVT